MTLRHFLTAACFSLLAAPLFAQGNLDPEGPPATGMKSLGQVEPRIDLATVESGETAMHVIRHPGSYYLSRNLVVSTTNGIEIVSGSVTLDLMGFSILREGAEPATGTAIVIAGDSLSNLAITNGHITGGVTFDPKVPGDQFTGPGFANGIKATGTGDPVNIRVSHVGVSGCDTDGVILGGVDSIILGGVDSLVEHCVVRTVGGNGIVAGQVAHCTATSCGLTGIAAGGNVSSSRGESVGPAPGIDAAGNVTHCTALGQQGILSRATVSHSSGKAVGTGFTHHGIAGTEIMNCDGEAEGGDGINAMASVTNSRGVSLGTNAESDGIEAGDVISYSRGTASGPGAGLRSQIAIGCTVAGGLAVGNTYLMPVAP